MKNTKSQNQNMSISKAASILAGSSAKKGTDFVVSSIEGTGDIAVAAATTTVRTAGRVVDCTYVEVKNFGKSQLLKDTFKGISWIGKKAYSGARFASTALKDAAAKRLEE
jgi:hypothetical protein